MPEYSQIQTYIDCCKKDFINLLNQYINFLSKINLPKDDLMDNMLNLEWKINKDGFSDINFCDITYLSNFEGCKFSVRPTVMIWTPVHINELKRPCVELSLLFHTEELVTNYKDFELRLESQRFITHCMYLMAEEFKGQGIYFTDETTDGKPCEGLIKDNATIWSFDAALIPASLLQFYTIRINSKPKNICYNNVKDNHWFINKEFLR